MKSVPLDGNTEIDNLEKQNEEINIKVETEDNPNTILTDLDFKEESTISTKCDKELIEKVELEINKKKPRPRLAVSHHLKNAKSKFFDSKNVILQMVDYNDYTDFKNLFEEYYYTIVKNRTELFLSSLLNEFFEIMMRDINIIDLRDLGNFSNFCDNVVKKLSTKNSKSICEIKFVNCIFQTFGRKSVNLSISGKSNNSKNLSNPYYLKNDSHHTYKNLVDEIIRVVTTLVNDFSITNNFYHPKINIENFTLEIFTSKMNHLYKNKNLEKCLKEQVDKFNDYYNISKVVEKQNFQIENEMSYIKELDESKFSTMCICCKRNSRNVILFPCNHYLFCNVCCKEILLCGECPICNVKIKNSQNIN